MGLRTRHIRWMLAGGSATGLTSLLAGLRDPSSLWGFGLAAGAGLLGFSLALAAITAPKPSLQMVPIDRRRRSRP